jgi:DNA processing protein
MITARFALDQNREVFVVPHPLSYREGKVQLPHPNRTGKAGSNHVEDILDEISIHTGEIPKRLQRCCKKMGAGGLKTNEEELCRIHG